MARDKDKHVLAFYPNPLGFGFAFMENALIVKDSQIVVSRPMCNKKLMGRIREYIDYYKPDIVILEDYRGKQSRKSKRVEKLIDSIVLYAREKNIEISTYARADIRFVFSNFNARSKHEIAKAIENNVPYFDKEAPPQRKVYQSEPYSMGVFDAVSLGITHYFKTG